MVPHGAHSSPRDFDQLSRPPAQAVSMVELWFCSLYARYTTRASQIKGRYRWVQRVPAGGLHRQFLAKFLRGRKLFPGNLFMIARNFTMV